MKEPPIFQLIFPYHRIHSFCTLTICKTTLKNKVTVHGFKGSGFSVITSIISKIINTLIMKIKYQKFPFPLYAIDSGQLPQNILF
jgi:hypothetical protein